MKSATLAWMVLAGCSPNTSTPVFAPNGKVGYQINCPEKPPPCLDEGHVEGGCTRFGHVDPIASCREEAARYCPSGFDVAADTTHQGGIVDTMPGYGAFTRHVILVTCK